MEFVAEYSHSQTRFGNGIPSFFVEVLDFGGAEGTVEDPLDHFAKHEGQKETKVRENHNAGIGLSKMNAGRVEIGPFVESLQDDT